MLGLFKLILSNLPTFVSVLIWIQSLISERAMADTKPLKLLTCFTMELKKYILIVLNTLRIRVFYHKTKHRLVTLATDHLLTADFVHWLNPSVSHVPVAVYF